MNFTEELNDIKKAKGKVDIRYLRYILHGLQWTSEEYCSALYNSARNIGKKIIAPDMKTSGIKDVCSEICKLFNELDVGKLTVKSIEDKKIIFEMKNGACSSKIKPVDDKLCFFEAGLIAGILEAKLKKEIKVHETLCGGLGDPVEEFEVNL